MFFEMQKIQLIEGDVWGHRKDISEYYNVPPAVIKDIRDLKLVGTPVEKIEEKVARESKLNPEMVAYILARDITA
ncbi:Ribosomal protein S6 [Methanosarcina sp. MTP4]|nr:Ribosomal protein S6 [Methanosarcina sp. MTP4]